MRLRRKLEEPRQIVVGTDGVRSIELRTTRDLSCVLDRVEPGSLISWDGRRVTVDEESQTWEVSIIEIMTPEEAPEFPG